MTRLDDKVKLEVSLASNHKTHPSIDKGALIEL
jgi:hypothetical protein